MFRNNLVIAWRNIMRGYVFSALNILSLAVGLAVFILIMLFVRYELSYDRYHENARNIYRVISKNRALTPGPLAPALALDFPEVQATARIFVSSDILFSVGEKAFLEKRIYWADPQTFEIFSFPLVRGDRATALKDPFSILLSERKARQYFGDAEPVGQKILCRYENHPALFTVTGVFRDIRPNSHFIMDIAAPFETGAKIANYKTTSWSDISFYTYVLLKDGVDSQTLNRKLPAFFDKKTDNIAGVTKNIVGMIKDPSPSCSLQPLTEIHLHPAERYEISASGNSHFVLLLASIAVLVLVIACINYMNLTTARSLKRTKEIGLRKVIGAAKGQIVRQFLGDSMLMTFLALLLATAMVLAVLPAFRTFFEREIAFNPFRDGVLMSGLILLAAVVGVTAGSYPAFFVSAFKPVSALRSAGYSKSRGRGLRSALILFQFAASIALIICAVGVRSQLRYIRHNDAGFDRKQILVLPPLGGHWTSIEAFGTELKQNPAILGVSASSSLPNNIDSRTLAQWPGRLDSELFQIYRLFVDYDYIDLFGLKIVEGRNFSRVFPSDARGAYIINECAQRTLGWADAVGREFGGGGVRQPLGKIVGVVKDFHMRSFHFPITPLFILLKPENTSFQSINTNYLSVKIRGENIPATLASIRKIWERFLPKYPFEYSFFDEIFDQAYRTDQRLGKIFSAFASLAVLIACLGFVGLASFTAEQKTKEIGIRKVLGASTSGVIALLSREFMKWVVLANLIAWPIGYFALHTWLQNFAYRTSLTVPIFLGAGLATFFIAAAVISLQTYRAAAANPAESMRYE
jgi:putative ABC transport system permease protein